MEQHALPEQLFNIAHYVEAGTNLLILSPALLTCGYGSLVFEILPNHLNRLRDYLVADKEFRILIRKFRGKSFLALRHYSANTSVTEQICIPVTY